ncbi:MAG: hypothetical protein A2Y93_00130 [Chloroflexi bacterium RBG_13_68_17]|nr:MAG: hypothetical protein A2Y93_00130 [Chloroflexi bacterium RBG_13_68_17]
MSCGSQLTERLRRSGFRVTPQRNVILETIAHMGDHLAAQEVFDRARRRLPGLNLATVYRTLDSLHRAGLLDLLTSDGQPVRYSLHDVADAHSHLVCRSCGRVLEVAAAAFDRLARSLKREHGFAADTAHLTLHGLCQECRVREPAPYAN